MQPTTPDLRSSVDQDLDPLVRYRVSAVGLLVLIRVLSACSDPAESADQSAPDWANASIGSDAWRSLPAAERAARIQRLQASVDPRFVIDETSPSTLSATQSEMRLRTTFERGRVSVSSANEADELKPIELGLTAWGCPGSMQDLAGAAPMSGSGHAAVRYAHPGLDEWYTLGPAGLEQGFTVYRLPECAKRAEKLRIRLRFLAEEGSIASVADDGQGAILTTPGRRGVHYSDPFARDSAGREHDARIIGGEALELEVDVREMTLPLTIDPLLWDVQQKLLPTNFLPPAFSPGVFFGAAVAASTHTVVVGAAGDREKGVNAGAVYVYERAAKSPGLATRWLPQRKLTASDGASGSVFGGAVAISGDTILVGAIGNGSSDHGAAYVFVRNGATWSEQQELTAGELGQSGQFGYSVAISGDTAVVGDPRAGAGEAGAAFIFVRSGATWSLQKRLTPLVPVDGQHFGAAVAISSSSVAVGRDQVTQGGVDWFTRVGNAWNAVGTSVSSARAHFGAALAMNDSVTVIGAYGSNDEPGLVNVVKTISPHTSLATLLASDGKAGDQFGYALGLSSSSIVVGAPSVDTAPGNGMCSFIPDSGAAYVFSANGSTWTQAQKLGASGLLTEELPGKPPVCDSGERLGVAVAMADTFVLMGAPLRSDFGAIFGFPNVGAVFENEYALTDASACTAASDCFSGYCVEGVCCQSACEGACRSCLAARKDPTHGYNGDWVTGVCGEVTVGTDPKNGCRNQGTTCGTLDDCSGTGSCQAANPPGTPCGGSNPFCATPTSAAGEGVCASFSCSSISFACERGYACKVGVCRTGCASGTDCDAAGGFVCQSGRCKLGVGMACTSSPECAKGLCELGVCAELPAPCEGEAASSSCAGAAGQSGEAGQAGDAARSGETGEAGASASGGAAGGTDAGSGGDLPSAASNGGLGGSHSDAGSAGDEGRVECVPVCAAGLFCNPHTGACEDELVTACGCRAAGNAGRRGTPLSLLTLATIALLRRRTHGARCDRPRS